MRGAGFLAVGNEGGDGSLDARGDGDARPGESEAVFPSVAGDDAVEGQVSAPGFPKGANHFAGHASVELAETQEVVPNLGILREGLGNAGELKDEQGRRDLPEPELG